MAQRKTKCRINQSYPRLKVLPSSRCSARKQFAIPPTRANRIVCREKRKLLRQLVDYSTLAFRRVSRLRRLRGEDRQRARADRLHARNQAQQNDLHQSSHSNPIMIKSGHARISSPSADTASAYRAIPIPIGSRPNGNCFPSSARAEAFAIAGHAFLLPAQDPAGEASALQSFDSGYSLAYFVQKPTHRKWLADKSSHTGFFQQILSARLVAFA
jgi:hypothetical protein